MILQTSQIVVISIKISIAVISRRQRAAMMVGLGGAGARGGPPEAAIAAAGWQARFWAVVRLLLAAGLGCGIDVGVVDVGSTPTALSICRIDQK